MKYNFKKGVTFILLTLFFLQNSCNKKVEPKLDSTIYQGCCGKKPVNFTVGKANIYVPNVFTPNGDKINDLFYPVVNNQVAEVQGFTIWSANSDTIIFSRPTINYNEIDSYGWDGYRRNAIGQAVSNYVGLFNYDMRIVTYEGLVMFVTGEACVIRCGINASVFKTKEGCYYPSQSNPNGTLDLTKKSNENNCF
jgi:hypothetical protein